MLKINFKLMNKIITFLVPLSAIISSCSIAIKDQEQGDNRPNIVLIMVDDMGYSDIGSYGSEIPTPNIDKLAFNGIRFSQFYNTARCCPTRASLLTGLFPHQTGIGGMTNSPRGEHWAEWGTDGYIGYLNRNCVTLAEVLKDAGYHTYMTGKWHLGYHAKDRWPLQRGFEKYYGIIAGASSYFKPQGKRGLTLMNKALPPPEEDYYTTDAFTDYAIKFVNEQEDNNPFFLYLAYNAPHWPLHAKQQDIEKFVGKYSLGWDSLRAQRFRKQVKMGLLNAEWGISQRDERVRPWSEVIDAQKDSSDYRMAVYAAQIFAVDYNIGKLIKTLEDQGELENTLILFLSDNGGCAEAYDEFGSKPFARINDPDFSGAVSYGIGWANVSNTPFFEYKVKTYEGGISTPLIAHWPNQIKSQAGKITHNSGYLIDIMPTILEVSGATYPEKYHQGQYIHPLEGKSLLPVFKSGIGNEHEYMYWEHQYNCAIRNKKWKAVKKLNDVDWKLFNLEEDRIESNDLATKYPGIVTKLDEKWHEWAHSHQVLPKKVN